MLFMTHDDAFLQDITSHPQDDTPRLIYADWLEEHGQPERAQFIRVQIRLARPGLDALQWEQLHRREQELLREYDQEWLAGLPKWDGITWGFHRGFPGAVQATFAAFQAHAEELFRLMPLQALRLS